MPDPNGEPSRTNSQSKCKRQVHAVVSAENLSRQVAEAGGGLGKRLMQVPAGTAATIARELETSRIEIPATPVETGTPLMPGPGVMVTPAPELSIQLVSRVTVPVPITVPATSGPP